MRSLSSMTSKHGHLGWWNFGGNCVEPRRNGESSLWIFLRGKVFVAGNLSICQQCACSRAWPNTSRIRNFPSPHHHYSDACVLLTVWSFYSVVYASLFSDCLRDSNPFDIFISYILCYWSDLLLGLMWRDPGCEVNFHDTKRNASYAIVWTKQ